MTHKYHRAACEALTAIAVRHTMDDAAFDADYAQGAAMTLCEATRTLSPWSTWISVRAWSGSSADTDPSTDLSLPTFGTS